MALLRQEQTWGAVLEDAWANEGIAGHKGPEVEWAARPRKNL